MQHSSVFLLVLLSFISTSQGRSVPTSLKKYPNTDIYPCIAPCIRVGNCGYNTPNPTCNITEISLLCQQTCDCVAFNSNGWLKGCGNASCGASFEDSPGTDTYIFGEGVPRYGKGVPVAPVEDAHYPPEEVQESATASPTLKAILGNGTGATLADPTNLNKEGTFAVGDMAFDFVLMAILPQNDTVVLERTFARWGFISYVSITGGEIARLRKGTGKIDTLTVSNYQVLVQNDPCYFTRVVGDPTDWLAQRIVRDTPGGEANYSAAFKYLAPQREYAVIGSRWTGLKFSVSPDGRIKRADGAIYTPDLSKNDPGPGTMVFDPQLVLPSGLWPASNFTYLKSALVGNYLRVVSLTAYEPTTASGFEQVAFAPECASVPNATVYIRLTAQSVEFPLARTQYLQVQAGTKPQPLPPETFYNALWNEQAMWNETFSTGAEFTLPGQEGKRQVDTVRGALVESMTLFVGLQANYGDGADYWSPGVDQGGSLPFQEIAVVQTLLEGGQVLLAGQYLGWWFDHYILPDGRIDMGQWKTYCPFAFADGFSDYGEMQDIFARVARAMWGYVGTVGEAWVQTHISQAVRLANYSYQLRRAAKVNASCPWGFIWGPPEHDTCTDGDYYFHNNAWFIRGMTESGKLFRDLGVQAAFGQALLDEATQFQADFVAALQQCSTYDNATGNVYFIPPIATKGSPVTPFHSMVESTLSEYCNFRYYSDLLGADVLPQSFSIALQDFRENHFGTLSGITRFSDHLDDMPASYYLAASLRDDRLERFFLLHYGHMANYMSPGTFTATEQLPIQTDATGFYRDYLWVYLEGGIDECVPSIMLNAFATRWQLVYERYDTDTLWIAKAAPRRWAEQGFYGVKRVTTRFGWVSVFIETNSNTNATTATAVANIEFTPVAAPGMTLTPSFAVRLRSSKVGSAIQPSSVKVQGSNVTLYSIDAGAQVIYINVTQSAVGEVNAFSVSAIIA